MSQRFNRVPAAYTGAAGLTNKTKYQTAEQQGNAFDPIKVDGDFNAIMDYLNELDDDITGVSAGAIPGASTGGNANKLLTTDGAETFRGFLSTAHIFRTMVLVLGNFQPVPPGKW